MNKNLRTVSLRRLILEKIAELGSATLDGFFPYKYPETRIWRKFLGLDPSYVFSKPTFSAILSQLRKDGFIQKVGINPKSIMWKITDKGKEILEGSGVKKDGVPRIISYDIPEKKRALRYWLRSELLTYDYKQIHKSVWIGFAPLPEEFFKTLDFLSLKNYIHIFSVDKKGTLQNFKNVS